MEFITPSLFNTTTFLTVTSGSISAINIIDRDLRFQYVTDGFNSDATTASIIITFDETLSISRIALMGHNLQSYTIFHSGVTANTFALTTTASTSVSDFSTNSETSQFFRTTTVTTNQITIDLKQTQVAGAEKAIGFLYFGDLKLDFETNGRDPSADNYSPSLVPKQVVHNLSDGGRRMQTVDEKFEADISYENIPLAFRDELRVIHVARDPFTFVPFGTSTSWDLILHEVVWTGGFDFFTFSDNAPSTGFSGSISLKETT